MGRVGAPRGRRPAPAAPIVLAENDPVAAHAIEIVAGPGTSGGRSNDPELDLDDLAAILASSADDMVATDQAPDVAWVAEYATSIALLGGDPGDEALARELRLDADLTMPTRRRAVIANFLIFAMARTQIMAAS